MISLITKPAHTKFQTKKLASNNFSQKQKSTKKKLCQKKLLSICFLIEQVDINQFSTRKSCRLENMTNICCLILRKSCSNVTFNSPSLPTALDLLQIFFYIKNCFFFFFIYKKRKQRNDNNKIQNVNREEEIHSQLDVEKLLQTTTQ